MVEKSGVKTKLHQKYLVGEEQVPSVSQALSIIDKPAMIYAAWKLGTEGINYKIDWADKASIGTLTHQMVFAHDTGVANDCSCYTAGQIKLAIICFNKYLAWEKQHTIKIIRLELPLVSKRYGFGGTFDKLCILDGVPTLIDYKTGKAFYKNMYYQAAAYKQLILENKVGKVKNVVVLRFGRKEEEGFEAWIPTKEQMKLGFKLFLDALHLYKKIQLFERM